MECWGRDDDKEDEAKERKACSELGWAAGIFAAAYLITLIVWKVCA